MTNQQGAPEALRLADAIDPFERQSAPDHLTSKVAADELRRLHAENERLAALVEAQQPADCGNTPYDEGPFTVAQQPAPSAAAMGDVDLPDAEDMAHSAVQEALSFGLSHDVIHRWMRHIQDQTVKAMLAAPQPSPTPQADSAQDEPLQAFDSPRAKALMRAWEEGWAACRDAEYVGEEAQNDAFNSSHTLTLCIAEDQQLPAPQADSQPALPKITAEDRSFLHDNPNTDDIVEWVQNYANAAINADRAARAPADSVTAPAGGSVAGPVSTVPLRELGVELRKVLYCLGGPQLWALHRNGSLIRYLDQFENDFVDSALAAAPTPSAQAADSVLEDAAREAIEKVLALFPFNVPIQMFTIGGGPNLTADGDTEFYSVKRVLAFLTEIKTTLDAARKQGANHD